MRIRWRDFEIPNSVICEEESHTSKYGKFLIEPFERGFGVTIGNSLRRILLSSLEGAAVASLKIEGVQHEFSTLTGVFEDVTDIILNVKNILLVLHEGDETVMTIRKDKKGEVFAGDIEHDSSLEVANPELHIATLTQDIPFAMEMRVRRGRGYVTADENAKGDHSIGTIWVDSSFSPVSRVRYRTEDTRVGQVTNYDRLILEAWTNGTLTPEMAMVEAAKILRRHLNPFVQYAEIGFKLQHDAGLTIEEGPDGTQDIEAVKKVLGQPIGALMLSVRARNCLETESIKTIGDLVGHTDEEMIKIRNFGKTSLVEIKKKLSEIGLSLGMDLSRVQNGKGAIA